MRPIAITLAAAAAALSVPAAGQPVSQAGSITMIRTGWNLDSFAVVTAEPIVNPAGCPTPDGYTSDKSFPGYETFYSAALTAFIARRRVIMVVDDTQCIHDRPKIVGINVTSE
ncbi:hypothetical protein [Methylocaldum szegediense]|uniref:Uncharacterized protein n=1 Tax=Methylocaldum szegediense TaxID=73780 RepID=A0ABM9I4I2_9GAMM|nr:hypothetical protein [Methylocaldum szegediense]CAI8887778.1 conserved exported protein of unknown function [Methylocaldum szegediense]